VRGAGLALLLLVVAYALLVAWGDAPSVAERLSKFPRLLILPILLLTVWNYALRWLKWQYYLKVLGVTGVGRLDSALVFLSGFAMGLTPGKSGELTKSYWLREIVGPERAPFARTAPIVFAERLTDGIAMLLLAGTGLAAFQFGAPALIAVGVLAVLAVTLIQARPLAHFALGLLARVPVVGKIAAAMEVAYESARELLTWQRLLIAVVVGVLSWGGECVALYVILLGLDVSPGLHQLNLATFTLAAGSLIGSASLAPGGLGAAEGTVALFLEKLGGLPLDIAAAATLLIRVCTLWFGVLLGAISLPVLVRRVVRRP
jgi:uncharacterized protein (TIRG00374 family)